MCLKTLSIVTLLDQSYNLYYNFSLFWIYNTLRSTILQSVRNLQCQRKFCPNYRQSLHIVKHKLTLDLPIRIPTLRALPSLFSFSFSHVVITYFVINLNGKFAETFLQPRERRTTNRWN